MLRREVPADEMGQEMFGEEQWLTPAVGILSQRLSDVSRVRHLDCFLLTPHGSRSPTTTAHTHTESLCQAAFQVSLHLRAHLIPPHSLVSGVLLVSPCVSKREAQINTVTSPGGPPSGHVRTWPQGACLQSSPPSLYFRSVSCQAPPHGVS